MKVLLSARALADLDRFADHLSKHESPKTATLIAGFIINALETLREHPLIGRPVEDGLRELVISRGRTGYIALYRFVPAGDLVRVLAIRHQREAGYQE